MYQGVNVAILRVTLDDGDTSFDVAHGLSVPTAPTGGFLPGPVAWINLRDPAPLAYNGLAVAGNPDPAHCRIVKQGGVGTACIVLVIVAIFGARILG
jgi:hypothetical protein